MLKFAKCFKNLFWLHRTLEEIIHTFWKMQMPPSYLLSNLLEEIEVSNRNQCPRIKGQYTAICWDGELIMGHSEGKKRFYCAIQAH